MVCDRALEELGTWLQSVNFSSVGS
jgi:hypothetical protein